MSFNQGRNKTAHIYNEEVAQETFGLANKSLPYIKDLLYNLSGEVRIFVSHIELAIILGVVKQLADDCKVLTFGSRVKGNHRQYSDLDLSFIKNDGTPLGMDREYAIKEAFAETDLNFRVDVNDYHSTSEEFKKIIDSKNIVVFPTK